MGSGKCIRFGYMPFMIPTIFKLFYFVCPCLRRWIVHTASVKVDVCLVCRIDKHSGE